MNAGLERSEGLLFRHVGDSMPPSQDANVIEISKCCEEHTGTLVHSSGVTKIDDEISYSKFFSEYLVTNSPCIISDFVSKDWASSKLWREGLKPKWSSLRKSFGDAEVPVADCTEREYNSQKKYTFTLNKYLDYLEEHIKDGYQSSKPNLYLKDWHLTRDYPAAAVYRVPNYFASDWLNEYFCRRKDVHDDYRFVYIGPKGSWTPLHADVFTSFSWSVNIVGRKRWVLFPPGEEVYLRDQFGNLAYDIFSEETHDKTKFPLCDKPGKYYDIIQEAGEAIFVPSGWHHQVWNLEDTISINHNWINGCNIKQIWIGLSSCLSAVQKEVSDCSDMDDWHSHCQVMLRATHGMNYEEFYDLLKCVAEPRMVQVTGGDKLVMYGGWELGIKHAYWDLKQISSSLDSFLNDPNVSLLSWVSEKEPRKLKENIDSLLQKLRDDV